MGIQWEFFWNLEWVEMCTNLKIQTIGNVIGVLSLIAVREAA